MTFSDLFLPIISLTVVFMWTLRLAKSKGRNPWVWCGAALAPVILSLATSNGSWQLISMVPMVALLFMKSPRAQMGPGPAGITCPRCQADHPHGRYYCTSCGWELTKEYPAEGAVAEETPRVATLTESLETAGSSPPTETIETSTAPVESTQTEEPPVIEPTPESAPEEEEPIPQDAQPEEPTVEHAVPVHPLAPVVTPTAVRLTDRGIEQFNDGKVQESIDQFTKALAMDPGHAEAWERRAEAYAKLGRNDEAEEDRRRLADITPAE